MSAYIHNMSYIYTTINWYNNVHCKIPNNFWQLCFVNGTHTLFFFINITITSRNPYNKIWYKKFKIKSKYNYTIFSHLWAIYMWCKGIASCWSGLVIWMSCWSCLWVDIVTWVGICCSVAVRFNCAVNPTPVLPTCCDCSGRARWWNCATANWWCNELRMLSGTTGFGRGMVIGGGSSGFSSILWIGWRRRILLTTFRPGKLLQHLIYNSKSLIFKLFILSRSYSLCK